ncbi:MAG: transglutaminase-like domain-containing protein [Planctomycetota bacterium]
MTPLISRRQAIVTAATSASVCMASRSAFAQSSAGDDGSSGPSNHQVSLTEPQTSTWELGLRMEPPVTCVNVFATFPFPAAWPEQDVKVINKTIEGPIKAWGVNDLPGGTKQVWLQVPQLLKRANMELRLEVELTRRRIMPPTSTDGLLPPKKVPRELKLYTGNSPYIDATHRLIRNASKLVAAQGASPGWAQVEAIYDYVRENVRYTEGDLKNASDALKDGTGDCEEMTSLFVAMCRNAKIPARMVWVEGHCYPEFYLVDEDEYGYWYPCQAAGSRLFGEMQEYRPIYQKGDRFKPQERKKPVRYISEFFRCDRRGKGTPNPEFFRKQV